jgi:tetratricopeptide (TPR) repeat protein
MRTLSKCVLVAAAAVLLGACGQQARAPSAKEREEELNRAKHRAADLLDAGVYAEALEALEELARRASGDHQVYTMMGDARAGLGDWKAAVADYESALRLSYTDHTAHLKLATLLMANGRIGRALTEFELAIRYGDRAPLTHYNYGLALREMERPEDALREWRLAHDMDSGDPRFAEAVGIGLTGVDDEQAIEYFAKAEELGASGASFANNFGLALQRTARYTEAGDYFRRAAEAEGANETYRFNLAALYTRSDACSLAVGEWSRMIERWGPRWSYAVYSAKCLHALGRHADAVEMPRSSTAFRPTWTKHSSCSRSPNARPATWRRRSDR